MVAKFIPDAIQGILPEFRESQKNPTKETSQIKHTQCPKSVL